MTPYEAFAYRVAALNDVGNPLKGKVFLSDLIEEANALIRRAASVPDEDQSHLIAADLEHMAERED